MNTECSASSGSSPGSFNPTEMPPSNGTFISGIQLIKQQAMKMKSRVGL
jgi:hypothetical protein